MFKKIFKFIKGYVIIKITGKNKERFVNMCLYNGLDVCDVIPEDGGLVLKTDYAGFRAMRRLARKCRVGVRIAAKRGLGRLLLRYRRRVGFFLSGAAVCIFFLALPQYILCVEIDGIYNADETEVREILRAHGVYPGAKKSGADDLTDIKNAVVFGAEGINWAWLYDEGARMRLQVQESVPAPEVRDKTTPTDIVAAADGMVRRADVFHGEKRVETGMTVTEGQLLVSGKTAVYPPGTEERYIYVHSDARIIADTVRRETGNFTSKETLRIRTGNKKTKFAFNVFGKTVALFRDIGGGFADFDTVTERKDFDIPIVGYSGFGLERHTVYEVNVTERELDRDEILARARESLEEKICRRLRAGAVKESEELSYSVKNGVYRVELRMHLRENIGIEIPTEE